MAHSRRSRYGGHFTDEATRHQQAKLVQILNLTETRTASKMLHSLRLPLSARLPLPLPCLHPLPPVFQTMCNALENTCFSIFFEFFFSSFFRFFRPQKLPACIMYANVPNTASDRPTLVTETRCADIRVYRARNFWCAQHRIYPVNVTGGATEIERN